MSRITVKDSKFVSYAIVLLRFGIGVGFLSAVAGRFGLWERLRNRMSTGGISHGSWNTAQAQLVFAGGNDPAAGGHRHRR